MPQYKDIATEVKDKANIVDAIGRIIQLRNSGKSHSALCPFHKETDGSFHVYEQTQTYICFGCGAKGDIIGFYMQYYNLDFKEALEKLCKEYGIDYNPSAYGESTSENLEPLYEINRTAGKLYYEQIKSEGNPGLQYLLDRKIDIKTIQKFRIGYANGSGATLYKEIASNDNQIKAAIEVGLLKDDRGNYRDKYFNRIMFPIVNVRGKVIGFGGRDITGNSKAKYINSDGSKVFAKGSNLYGLNISKGDIRTKGYAILVEGYMDAVALYMHGVTNVVAQLGTAFTEQQAKLLKRFTSTVILSLDSDDSGIKAAEASCDILKSVGMRVRVLILNGAKDPDEFITNFGLEAFEAAVENAMPMYDFKLDCLRKRYKLEASDEISAYLSKATELVSYLTPIEQDYYVKKLAAETSISPEAIYRQINMSAADNRHSEVTISSDMKVSANPAIIQRTILCLALQSTKYLQNVQEYRYIFDDSPYSDVFSALLSEYECDKNAEINIDKLYEVLDDDNTKALKRLVSNMNTVIGSDPDMQFADCLRQLEIKMIQENYDKLVSSLNETDEDIDTLVELDKMQKRIRELNNNN